MATTTSCSHAPVSAQLLGARWAQRVLQRSAASSPQRGAAPSGRASARAIPGTMHSSAWVFGDGDASPKNLLVLVASAAGAWASSLQRSARLLYQKTVERTRGFCTGET